jgi:hypothetical protein
MSRPGGGRNAAKNKAKKTGCDPVSGEVLDECAPSLAHRCYGCPVPPAAP